MKLRNVTFRTCDVDTYAGREWLTNLALEATAPDYEGNRHPVALIAHAETILGMEFETPVMKAAALRYLTARVEQFLND